MTQTTTTDRRQKLLDLQIPKGGARFDMGEEWIFVLKPITIDKWKMAKKMIEGGQSTEAAVMLVNSLAVDGSRKASEIPEHKINLFMALESSIASLIEPVEVDIKKNQMIMPYQLNETVTAI